MKRTLVGNDPLMDLKFSYMFKILIVLILLVILNPSSTFAIDNYFDFSGSDIVVPKKMTNVEKKAIVVLQEEIYKRTGINLKTRHKWPTSSQPVIAVGNKAQLSDFAGSFSLDPSIGKEGFQIQLQQEPSLALLIVGNDERGVLYGIGHLLRKMRLTPQSIDVSQNINIVSTPRYAIRGHQLGYRPKTNAYDAWDVEQYDQYIRELALFGANSIEIMPPRTDDDLTSPHMKVPPMKMMKKTSEIIDSYGMDVWIWYPNMGQDYEHPDSLKKELQERENIFKSLKRIDVVFVPGGDPGDLHPDILFNWLEQVSKVLLKYHPQAKVWVSPQAFRPVKEWLDAFYGHVNENPDWFGGVVFGPWVKTPLPEIRRIVNKDIPIRRYPDITHSLSSQYPVRDWDLAFAMTLGRECYNPRPVAEKDIHNALDEYANGSLSYSEGINDDVNKFIWSGQDWDPTTPVIETLRDFSRLFISPDYAEDVAQGLLALERNWVGPLLTNQNVERTCQQWQRLEKKVPDSVSENYRFQMGLLRAYYDAYIKQRLTYETDLERQAWEILRTATQIGSENALLQAENVLKQAWEKPVASDYRRKCELIADFLFEKIGSQLYVKKHGAKSGRGNFMDFIDNPLNDAVWLLSQFDKIKGETSEEKRIAAIEDVINRTNPGPGGFYYNFGASATTEPVGSYPEWFVDPGNLQSPRISFGVGLHGEEWVHTIESKGFDGSATPLAWMNQVTTLYDTPLTMVLENLDPESSYKLKIAYTGRFRSRISLTADGLYKIHNLFKTGLVPIHEYTLPQEATKDGILELSWTCGEGERGAQVAEIWLIKEKGN